jgi:hypothetical protein
MVRGLGKYATFGKVRSVSIVAITVEFDTQVGHKHTDQTNWCSGNAVDFCSGRAWYSCREVLCFSLSFQMPVLFVI